jgi:uncharacterized protein YecA (UPF0149 family)
MRTYLKFWEWLDKLLHRQPPKSTKQLKRNDPCWCGSGKKYKKCHYEADQKYFSSIVAKTCKTSS